MVHGQAGSVAFNSHIVECPRLVAATDGDMTLAAVVIVTIDDVLLRIVGKGDSVEPNEVGAVGGAYTHFEAGKEEGAAAGRESHLEVADIGAYLGRDDEITVIMGIPQASFLREQGDVASLPAGGTIFVDTTLIDGYIIGAEGLIVGNTDDAA